MHKHHKPLISFVALLLCFLTLFSSAFAYTEQNAASGFPTPPSIKGGGGGTPSGYKTWYNEDSIVIGYRFTCWRSEDYETYYQKYKDKPEVLERLLKAHDLPGKQLGHTINIIVSARNRYDYANCYGNIGVRGPRMFTNEEQNTTLNKISLAQTEIKSDKEYGPSKLMHSTATDLSTLQFSGTYKKYGDGKLDKVDKSSTFTFTAPIYQNMDKDLQDKQKNPLLNTVFNGVSAGNPLTIYSGYMTMNDTATGYINTGASNGQANNLYTYLYGFKYNNDMSADPHLGGRDMSPYLTISDIDYENTTGREEDDVRPFNSLPSNVINTNDTKSWTNRNSALIATLCGLTPRYGVSKIKGLETGEQLTDSEFGLYDYIIVEPIYSVYYYEKRYFVTASDCSVLHAQSQAEAFGDSKNCWYTTHTKDYNWCPDAPYFPALFGTYTFATDNYFGVDGVLNAMYGAEGSQGKYQPYTKYLGKRANYDIDEQAVMVAQGKHNLKEGDKGWYAEELQDMSPNTHSFVFTNKNGTNTLFIGSRRTEKGKQDIVWWGRGGPITAIFLAPYIPIEAMIGAGVWMAGTDSEVSYEIVYHSNPNSGSASDNEVTFTQSVPKDAALMTLGSYSGFSQLPTGKVATTYWTYDGGSNHVGIPDNSINSIPEATSSTDRAVGKVAVGHSISGNDNIKAWFEKYGSYSGNQYTVHLYAAWNTKALVTTLDRTFTDDVQSLVTAAGYKQFYGDDINETSSPTAISLVQVTGTTASTNTVNIVPLKRDSYTWYPETFNQASNVTTYIVYSLVPGKTITNSDKANIISMINNGTKIDGMQIYTVNNAKVKWDMSSSGPNFFYFDLYTFEVRGMRQSFEFSIYNTPVGAAKDKNNTAYTNASFPSFSDSCELHLVRGVTVSYTSYANAGLAYAAGEIGNIKDYTNGNNAWIKDESNAKTTILEVQDSVTTTQFAQTEILGKQVHTLNVNSGYRLNIIPRVNGTRMLPFDNYFVRVFTDGKDYHYGPSYSPYEQDDGTVQVNLLPGANCEIYVSATDQSGTSDMRWSCTVSTADSGWTENPVDGTKEKTVYVDYSTLEYIYQSASGAAHGGHDGNLTISDTTDKAISDYTAVRVQGASQDSLCNAPVYYNKVSATVYTRSMIAGTNTSNNGNLKATIARVQNLDWYLGGIKVTTGGSVMSPAPTIRDDGSVLNETLSGGTYSETITVTQAIKYEYTFLPYTRISVTLDNIPVSWNTVFNTKPSGFSEYNNGLTTDLQAPYGTSASIPTIINAANLSTKADNITITHNGDYVQDISLNYYTITTTADDGYTPTGYYNASTSGTNMGTKSYVLANHTVGKKYQSCVDAISVETGISVDNTKTYKSVATTNGTANFKSCAVKPMGQTGWMYPETKITKSGTVHSATFTGCSIPKTATSNEAISDATNFHWNSTIPVLDEGSFVFVFRINDVPYDTLPQTVGNRVSLSGKYDLKFSTDSNGRIIATGAAPIGTYTLFLDGKDTGVSYDVKEGETFFVDFYTLRVVAGKGINNVSLAAYDNGTKWNGTLAYIAPGNNRVYDTLAIFPESISNSAAYRNITINAKPARDYSFVRWDTKYPTANVSITYGSTTASNTTVNVANINHATVVQAEGTTEPTPIVIPAFPEHNMLYYGVRLRTFLDNSMTNPWNDIMVHLFPTADTQLKDAPQGVPQAGMFSWAVCIDEYQKQTVTQQNSGAARGTENHDPYENTKATGYFTPAKEMQGAYGASVVHHHYSASNAYVANQYINIDAFYYTQTFQMQVNTVNTTPWNDAPVTYTILFNNYRPTSDGIVTTAPVNNAGFVQTVVVRGTEISVASQKHYKTSALKTSYALETVERARTYLLPYYTVTIGSQCGETPKLNNLTLKIDGHVVSYDDVFVMMEGSYSLSTTTSPEYSGHSTHTFQRWAIKQNEVFVLKYEDSGDSDYPFPTLTYTGAKRDSLSDLSVYNTAAVTLNVKDETNLIALFGCSPTINLTVNAYVQDSDGKILTNDVLSVMQTIGQNNVSVPLGTTVPITKGEDINLTGVLENKTIYYPTQAKIEVKLDGSPSTTHTVYYSVSTSFPDITEALASAPSDPAQRAAHLAKKGIVEMVHEGNGIYSGIIPYNEQDYHLFVDGILQNQTVRNDKKTTYRFGQYNNANTVWTGSATSNKEKVEVINPQENVVLNVYATRVTSGSEPSPGIPTVNLHTVTIYTNTDYQPVMPYNGWTTIEIATNGGPTQVVTLTDTKYSFVVFSGTYLELSPRVSLSANTNQTHMKTPMYSGIVNGSETFLLSYNTVTVSGDEGIKTTLNGSSTTKGVFLGHYAVGSGALKSANTTIDVNAEVSGQTNQKVHHNQSTIRVHTLAGQKVTLKAQDVQFEGYEQSRISGDGKYYIYIMPWSADATTPEGMRIIRTDEAAGYYVGMSTDATIPGNLATNPVQSVVLLRNRSYVLHVNYKTMQTRITAAPGTQFEAAATNGIYTFSTLPDGTYEIYMNGTLLATQASDITSVDGKAATKHGNTIIVDSTKEEEITTGIGFKNWSYYYTPGTAHKTYTSAGTQSATTTYSASSLTAQVVQGTSVYYAVRTGSSLPGQLEDEANVYVVSPTIYKVITYLDGVAKQIDISEVVLFNDGNVKFDQVGQSGELFSVAQPTLRIKPNSHDRYTVMYTNGNTVAFPLNNNDTLSGSCEVYLLNAATGTVVTLNGTDAKVTAEKGSTQAVFTNVPAGQYTLRVNGQDRAQVFQVYTYSQNDQTAPIVYNSSTKTFHVYYYSVTFSVKGEGDIENGATCNENVYGPVVVAKQTPVTVADTILTVNAHSRIAKAHQIQGKVVRFHGWSKTVNGTSSPVDAPITNTSHFTAVFDTSDNVEEIDYTITLYNKASKWTLKYLNVNSDALTSRSTYGIKSTNILNGVKGSVAANAPNSVMDTYHYGEKGTMNAFLPEPMIHTTTASSTSIVLTLTGPTSEKAHTVKLVSTTDSSVFYTASIAAGSYKATFASVPTGYYQLYIDDIKYSTEFSYYTHGAECKVEGQTEGTLIRPSYNTEAGAGGIIYVAPRYDVRVAAVSAWKQVLADGSVLEDFSTVPVNYRPTITYSYTCDACNKSWTTTTATNNVAPLTKCSYCSSTYMRMTSSQLTTPIVEDNQVWEVYSTYSTKQHNPVALNLNVEMAYPVIIKSVLDNTQKLPFSNAEACIVYSVDNWATSQTVKQKFDATGTTVFYLPMGAQYYIAGASSNANATTTYVTTGLSAAYNSHSTSGFVTNANGYVTGDGDENNDGTLDDPARTVYFRYFTVTAKAGTGIKDVEVKYPHNSSFYNTGATNTTISMVYMYGQTASTRGYLANGTSTVTIKVTKDDALYNPSALKVYLSTSSTSNDEAYQLTYDATAKAYVATGVAGTPAGTTYYVWMNGKSLGTTFEYTNVSVVVKPYTGPGTWSGNAAYRTASSTLTTANRTLANEAFVFSFYVDRTITETLNATSKSPVYTPSSATAEYVTLSLTYDNGIASVSGAGTYLKGETANIAAGEKPVQNSNLGRTQVTVTLLNDGKPFKGQTVTIGGYATTEVSDGVYRTTQYLGDGSYAVVVNQKNCTLLDTGKTMGTITVDSTRTYTWKAWVEGHATCSKCGVVGDCCADYKCTATAKCTNCHITTDANGAITCKCVNDTHNYSACPYTTSCKSCLTKSAATKANSIVMQHTSHLRAITTFQDKFTFTGDTTINFYTLRLDGDAGIKSITINGTTYNAGTTLTAHGKNSVNGSTTTNDLFDRVFTDNKGATQHVASVIVKSGRTTTISATVKNAVSNHAEAKTDAYVYLTVDGKPYTGRTVTIGGYTATDADNDGYYVTSGANFASNTTHDVVVDGRKVGTVTITSTRSYQWYTWSEPWNSDAHTCTIHGEKHACGDCDALLSAAVTTNSNSVANQTRFAHLVARTKFKDTFTFTFKDNSGTTVTNIPYYSLTINQYLNNNLTDDLPIKFTNTTTGVTNYIIPDGTTYYVYDANGTKLSNVPYVSSLVDGKVVIVLLNKDSYTIDTLDEVEDKNQDDNIDINDIVPGSLKDYTYKQHTTGTMTASKTVEIKYFTLTVKVYNNGTLGMPGGNSINGSNTTFESPVWLDDVANKALHDTAPNFEGIISDSIGDTAMNSVKDATTVKAYLSGEAFSVQAKASDNDSNNSGTLTNIETGTITNAKTVNVYYWSLTVDHYGGFTNTKITNPGGVTAPTPTGATSNAIAKAWFLNGTSASATATLANNNKWFKWTSNITALNNSDAPTAIVTMTAETTLSAHAKTFYTVRDYLHDKKLNWQNVYTQTFDGYEINNRAWVTTTVTGNANKYVNFDAYLTNYYADSTAAQNILRDNWAWGTPNTVIRIAIAADQSGGISYVDYFYTRNGSVNKPTPTAPGTAGPGDGTDTDYTTHPDAGVNDDINTTTNSAPKEYVNITYIEKNPSTGATLATTKPTATLVGTDITLIDPTKNPPSGYEFIGWALNEDGSGMIGSNDDHYILSKDTTVYAVYAAKLDLGITANDIYGTIKTNSKFMTSAMVVNHTNLSIIPGNHIQAKLRIRVNGTLMSEAATDKIVSYFSHSCTCADPTTCKQQNSCHDIIVPGNGTQLIWATVDTAGWQKNNKYELEWYLVFPSNYDDKVQANNQSKLKEFNPETQAVVANTARPDFSTTEPSNPSTVSPYNSSNTKFKWEYWTWNFTNSTFNKVTDGDMMSITIILKPENESGLRTYEFGAFNMHNYTTRSGYGLSLHSIFNDCTLGNKFSNITANSTTGTLEAVMTFPEFNYADQDSYDTARGALNQYYTTLQVIGTGKTRSLMFQQYTDLKTEDEKDKLAHYTPMWLPDGKYVPVTYVSGLWTPLGEMRATVQQGEFGTSESNMNKFGIYTNMIIIKGSLYDDLYNNP